MLTLLGSVSPCTWPQCFHLIWILFILCGGQEPAGDWLHQAVLRDGETIQGFRALLAFYGAVFTPCLDPWLHLSTPPLHSPSPTPTVMIMKCQGRRKTAPCQSILLSVLVSDQDRLSSHFCPRNPQCSMHPLPPPSLSLTHTTLYVP